MFRILPPERNLRFVLIQKRDRTRQFGFEFLETSLRFRVRLFAGERGLVINGSISTITSPARTAPPSTDSGSPEIFPATCGQRSTVRPRVISPNSLMRGLTFSVFAGMTVVKRVPSGSLARQRFRRFQITRNRCNANDDQRQPKFQDLTKLRSAPPGAPASIVLLALRYLYQGSSLHRTSSNPGAPTPIHEQRQVPLCPTKQHVSNSVCGHL